MLKFIHKFTEDYLKDAVYAASDGIVTTFVVVSGVAGASLSPVVVLILGFVNVFADGISMAAGNYLGTKSESDQFQKERDAEAKIFETSQEAAEKELNEVFQEKGYNKEDAKTLIPLITKNKKFFLDFIIFERKGLAPTTTADAIKASVVTFFAFLIAGTLPLIPYLFFGNEQANLFFWASVFAGGTMFIVGAARTIYSDKKWWVGGLEMLFVAGLAAVTAYFIGALLSGLVSGAGI